MEHYFLEYSMITQSLDYKMLVCYVEIYFCFHVLQQVISTRQ